MYPVIVRSDERPDLRDAPWDDALSSAWPTFMTKDPLKPNGTLYASFGLGRGEREANGRRFTSMDGDRLAEIVAEAPALEPLRVWESEDGRTGGRGAWLNALMERRRGV